MSTAAAPAASSLRDLAEQSNAWPFEEAKKIVARLKKTPKDEVIFETGYGPSGLPHIGTFGEVARTTMVRHAFRVLTDENGGIDAGEVFGTRKADHRILNTVLSLSRSQPDHKVILITKDINLRLKARALNVPAEDYETVKVKDPSHLPKGKDELEIADGSSIDRLYQEESLPVEAVLAARPASNQYYILRSGSKSVEPSASPSASSVKVPAGPR